MKKTFYLVSESISFKRIDRLQSKYCRLYRMDFGVTSGFVHIDFLKEI